MAPQHNLGTKLVENFDLLFEYVRCEECMQHVNERMLCLPDRRSFQCVMMYFLDIMDKNWRSKSHGVFVTKQDERYFHNILCDNLKTLRKEFPEEGLPLLTPSSLVCFYGEKSRETLWKITNSLMLMIMKRENFEMKENGKEMLGEYEALCEENNNFRREIEEMKRKIEKTISCEREILSLIISTENWDENTQTRLLDIDDRNIVSDISKKNERSLENLKLLKKKLQPYLDHIHHENLGNKCHCLPKFFLPEEVVSKIHYLFLEDSKLFIRNHIKTLKCAAAVRNLKNKTLQDTSPDIWKDGIGSMLIERLENLVRKDKEPSSSSLLDANLILGDSPLAFPMNSPELDKLPMGFTPFIARSRKKMKIPTVKMDAESVANLIAPVKVSVAPNNSFMDSIIACASAKKPAQNETIMSIVQRMRSKATPCKFSNQKYDTSKEMKTSFSSSSSSLMFSSLLSKGAMSSSKGQYRIGKFTPASKLQKPLVSRSTDRRQSAGFVKPSNCLVRRQLDTGVSLGPTNTITNSVERSKNSTGKPDRDSEDIIDRMVKKMVADENSFFNDDSDLLDSSLSGVECLISPSVSNTLQPEQNGENKGRIAQPKNLNVSDLMSEIIEEDNELANTLTSLKDEISATEHDQNIVLDDKDLSQVLDSKLCSQPQIKAVKKGGRDSISSLIERFQAIKKAHQDQ